MLTRVMSCKKKSGPNLGFYKLKAKLKQHVNLII